MGPELHGIHCSSGAGDRGASGLLLGRLYDVGVGVEGLWV